MAKKYLALTTVLLAGCVHFHATNPSAGAPPKLVIQPALKVPAGAALVPGVTNPLVTQSNIGATICNKTHYGKNGLIDPKGFTWVHWQRPPVSYTNRLKLAQMKAWGIKGAPNSVEEDHNVSIENAGHPMSFLNLWPQLWTGRYNAHDKDHLENYIHGKICSGAMTLAQGQAVFLGNLTLEYDKVFGK